MNFKTKAYTEVIEYAERIKEFVETLFIAIIIMVAGTVTTLIIIEVKIPIIILVVTIELLATFSIALCLSNRVIEYINGFYCYMEAIS